MAATSTADRVAALARCTGTTVVAGVTESAERTFRNSAVAWAPDGRIVDRYEKVHRVPFGEYIPARGLFEQLSDMTALVPRDVIPGDGPRLLRTPVAPLGVVISHEVFFSDRARAAPIAGDRSCSCRRTPPRTPLRRCRRPSLRPPGCGPWRWIAPSYRQRPPGTRRSSFVTAAWSGRAVSARRRCSSPRSHSAKASPRMRVPAMDRCSS